MIQLWVSPAPRRRRYALSDTQLDPHSKPIRLTEVQLGDYLRAKREYEAWQDRFRKVNRYGWW